MPNQLDTIYVRADFFQNGLIVPICFSIDSTRYLSIDRVLETSCNYDNRITSHYFVCRSGALIYTLLFENNGWFIINSPPKSHDM